MLETLDKSMHDSVINGDYFFWEEPAGSAGGKRTCGIAAPFVAWKEHGVLACISWTYFGNELGYSHPALIFQKRRMQALFKKASKDTGTWLQDRNFPRELVECFIPPQKMEHKS
jgi:hypothetical protein